MALTARRRLPRFLVWAGLLAIAGYYAAWGGEYSAFDLRRIAQLQAQQQAQLEAARERVDSLRAHAERLDSDAATLERLARERFGMIRDGELLYRFVEPRPSADPRAHIAVSP